MSARTMPPLAPLDAAPSSCLRAGAAFASPSAAPQRRGRPASAAMPASSAAHACRSRGGRDAAASASASASYASAAAARPLSVCGPWSRAPAMPPSRTRARSHRYDGADDLARRRGGSHGSRRSSSSSSSSCNSSRYAGSEEAAADGRDGGVVHRHTRHEKLHAARQAPAPAQPPQQRLPAAGEGSSGGGSPQTEPPRRPGRAPRAPDYYPNVGSVIEHLRDDYPHLLEREPDMSVYTDNIVFTERSTGYAVFGKHAYRNLLWALRVQFRLFCASFSVAIHSLYHDDDAGIIYLRWRIQATPRVYGLMRHPPNVVLDAMSVYKLGASGFICEHDLDNSAPVRPRLRPIIEDILSLGTIGIPGRSEPAGAGVGSSVRLQSSSSSRSTVCPYLAPRSSGVRNSDDLGSTFEQLSEPHSRSTWFATLDKAKYRPLIHDSEHDISTSAQQVPLRG